MSGTAISVGLRPGRLWQQYCTALEQTPLRIKAATAATGFALGDLVAQLATRTPGEAFRFDVLRTARLALYGGAIGGPIGHFWYNYLDQVIFPTAPKSAQAIVSKIALDQAIMSPMGACLFFSYIKLMDGFQVFAVGTTLQEKLIPTVLNSLKLWPLAHAVNFAFIPPSQRILYINTIAIGWTALLSVASSRQDTPTAPEVEVVVAGPGPVVNVLEAGEEPVTASQMFLEQAEPEVPPPAPRPSLRRRAVSGVGSSARRVGSLVKFW